MAHEYSDDENELASRAVPLTAPKAGDPDDAPTADEPWAPSYREMLEENARLKNDLEKARAENFDLWRLADEVRTKIRCAQAIHLLAREYPRILGGNAIPNYEIALMDAVKTIELTENKFDRLPF